MTYYRAVLLCSRIGYLPGATWETVQSPFMSASAAARYCAFIFGAGGCIGWTVEEEVWP